MAKINNFKDTEGTEKEQQLLDGNIGIDKVGDFYTVQKFEN